MYKFAFLLIFFIYLTLQGFCQQLLTEQEAVTLAIKKSNTVAASNLTIQQQKQLVKGSINLPNPEVFVESPTGNFYTASITQSFEFPTVYTRQKQLQKQQVVLAEREAKLTASEISLEVRKLYVNLQYAQALEQKLYGQDTVFTTIAQNAARQFDAGQIDYLQKSFAESQAGQIHNEYVTAQFSVIALQQQLFQYTGVAFVNVQPIENGLVLIAEPDTDTTWLAANLATAIYRQSAVIANKNISLQEAKALPGLAFGYFNQGERNTPFQNRFRLGITVPLWYGQYKSQINAAKTSLLITEQQALAYRQQLLLANSDAAASVKAGVQQLQYYQNTGLPKANDILNTAKRLFESGQNDYINFLRTISDVYAIQLKYLQAVKDYKTAQLNVQFLKGQL